ncbi:MAG: hypothetical protein CL811_06640 [Colwelliaceae bacterium]|jgi:hypothetical protein|nr:hypothetical protein [Colwelliaceae bacterium]|tara:strand:- start:13396 stop:13740 length:345 start_codon:yes stop_codon:yes gene_type:complete
MSKLSALQGKSKTYNIGGIDLELKPLTVEEMELFSIDTDASAAEQMESSKKLIAKVLKNSVPDATDEEISSVSLEHLAPLMEAIMELHKMSEGDNKMQKVKDVIAARTTQEKSN